MRGVVNSRMRSIVDEIGEHILRLGKGFTQANIKKIIMGVMPPDLVKLNIESMDELINENFVKDIESVMTRAADFILDDLERKQFDTLRADVINALGLRAGFLRKRYEDSFLAAFDVVTNGAQRGLSVRAIELRLRGKINLRSVQAQKEGLSGWLGVSKKQAAALDRAERLFVEQGLSIKEANDLVRSRGQQLVQRRHIAIARTELNFSFNKGLELGVRQAMDEGLISTQTVKVWQTVEDAAVECICQPLNGEQAKLNEQFEIPEIGGSISGPPAHVNCRCSLTFKEP